MDDKKCQMKKALNTRGRVNAEDSVFHTFHLILLHDCGANSSYLCLCIKKKEVDFLSVRMDGPHCNCFCFLKADSQIALLYNECVLFPFQNKVIQNMFPQHTHSRSARKLIRNAANLDNKGNATGDSANIDINRYVRAEMNKESCRTRSNKAELLPEHKDTRGAVES